jgi:hypothetical protein
MLIGLIGKAGSGKTTIANYLINEHNFIRISFTDSLKQMLIKAGLCTHSECYFKKTDRSRELMQKIGTGIFREQIDEDFWVKRAEPLLDAYLERPGGRIVIDDVRFLNEAQCIRSKGGIIVRVLRPGHNLSDHRAASHRSETELDAFTSDYILSAEDGQISKLEQGIRDVIISHITKADPSKVMREMRMQNENLGI